MNKAELIDLIMADKKSGFDSKASAERAVNAVIGALESGIKKDRKVAIVGFGTFSVRDRKARIGRNPQTGQEIKIKASRTVGFKPGKALKDQI
ncbi:HU family DNA-binding protein [bacterium]|nr:HU family DNA-binding protein [bacterium]